MREAAPGGAGSPVAAQMAAISWEPVIEMGQELYPSYLLATATATAWAGERRMVSIDQNGVHYIGDQLGQLGASVALPAGVARPGARVRLKIEARGLAARSVMEAVLPAAGVTLELFPRVLYDYDWLLAVRQPVPVNVSFRLFIDGESAGEASRVVRVRSVNDVPFAAVHRSGETQDLSWMFAAYVNENHPLVDQLLREALATGVVTRFRGYQGTPQEVMHEVFALWNVFQRRGLRYSSISRASGLARTVVSQHVRSLEEALAAGQANCADGSLLFASVLRKIGLDPVLVLVPGHMYVRFWLDGEHTRMGMLETTLLGAENLTRLSEDESLGGALAGLLGVETKNQASWRTFHHAFAVAAQNYNRDRVFAKAQASVPGYAVIDIADWREQGLMPINK